MEQENKGHQNASDHLANERTFLAWIRTGLGIMPLGSLPTAKQRRLSSIIVNDKCHGNPDFRNEFVPHILPD
jgi:putative membrane protein